MSWLIIRSSIPYYPFGRSCFSRRNCPWVTVLYQQQIQACMLWPFYFVKGLFTTLLDLSRLWITALEWWNQEVLSVDSGVPRVRPRMVDCANNWEGGGCLRPPKMVGMGRFQCWIPCRGFWQGKARSPHGWACSSWRAQGMPWCADVANVLLTEEILQQLGCNV